MVQLYDLHKENTQDGNSESNSSDKKDVEGEQSSLLSKVKSKAKSTVKKLKSKVKNCGTGNSGGNDNLTSLDHDDEYESEEKLEDEHGFNSVGFQSPGRDQEQVKSFDPLTKEFRQETGSGNLSINSDQVQQNPGGNQEHAKSYKPLWQESGGETVSGNPPITPIVKVPDQLRESSVTVNSAIDAVMPSPVIKPGTPSETVGTPSLTEIPEKRDEECRAMCVPTVNEQRSVDISDEEPEEEVREREIPVPTSAPTNNESMLTSAALQDVFGSSLQQGKVESKDDTDDPDDETQALPTQTGAVVLSKSSDNLDVGTSSSDTSSKKVDSYQARNIHDMKTPSSGTSVTSVKEVGSSQSTVEPPEHHKMFSSTALGEVFGSTAVEEAEHASDPTVPTNDASDPTVPTNEDENSTVPEEERTGLSNDHSAIDKSTSATSSIEYSDPPDSSSLQSPVERSLSLHDKISQDLSAPEVVKGDQLTCSHPSPSAAVVDGGNESSTSTPKHITERAKETPRNVSDEVLESSSSASSVVRSTLGNDNYAVPDGRDSQASTTGSDVELPDGQECKSWNVSHDATNTKDPVVSALPDSSTTSSNSTISEQVSNTGDYVRQKGEVAVRNAIDAVVNLKDSYVTPKTERATSGDPTANAYDI